MYKYNTYVRPFSNERSISKIDQIRSDLIYTRGQVQGHQKNKSTYEPANFMEDYPRYSTVLQTSNYTIDRAQLTKYENLFPSKKSIENENIYFRATPSPKKKKYPEDLLNSQMMQKVVNTNKQIERKDTFDAVKYKQERELIMQQFMDQREIDRIKQLANQKY